jgi:hypothetical protein
MVSIPTSPYPQEARFQRQFPQLVLLMAAGGFGLTLVELLLMGHVEKTQVAGLVTAGLGVVVSLAGLLAKGAWRKVVIGLLLFLALEGIAGTIFHRIGDPQKAPEAPLPSEKAEAPHEEHAPPLAPLSLSGLAMLAACAVVARPKVRS